jgi:SnoaL-like domain
MQSDSSDKLAISDLLAKFFACFDCKTWDRMRTCLCDVIYTDYSSFRDVPPAEISGDRFVEQRRMALKELDMQHNFLNLQTEVSGNEAAGCCNYIIHRFHPNFDGNNDQFFHSYGHYHLRFRKLETGWRISSIRQVLMRNHGNPEIHGATRTVDNTRHV